MQRFRDQGEAICALAGNLSRAGRDQDAAEYYQKAREVAEAHGVFSVECRACLGLGQEALRDGRVEEGMMLLRNALAAVPLSEDEDRIFLWEPIILESLIEALFTTHAVDEVEPLVMRHREAAKTESAREGRLCVGELNSLLFSARLHEVRASSSRFVNPSTLLGTFIHQGR